MINVFISDFLKPNPKLWVKCLMKGLLSITNKVNMLINIFYFNVPNSAMQVWLSVNNFYLLESFGNWCYELMEDHQFCLFQKFKSFEIYTEGIWCLFSCKYRKFYTKYKRTCEISLNSIQNFSFSFKWL